MSSAQPWLWEFRADPDAPEEAARHATLCTLGNGTFATRGATTSDDHTAPCYPGTYAAGVYNNTHAIIEGDHVDIEAAVRLPNWLPLVFHHRDADGRRGPALAPGPHCAVQSERFVLDMRHGILHHHRVLLDTAGRRTRIHEQRIIHAEHASLALQKVTVHAENWSGPLTAAAAIDADVRNAQVERYVEGRHLDGVTVSQPSGRTAWLTCHTTQSLIGIAVACVLLPAAPRSAPPRPGTPLTRLAHMATAEMECHVAPDAPLAVHKLTALRCDRSSSIEDLRSQVLDDLATGTDPEHLLTAHSRTWHRQWTTTPLPPHLEHAEVLRLYRFHLQQVINTSTRTRDAGIPARGLHGEEYQGRVFWDEAPAIAWLARTFPSAARSALDYRHRRLAAATREAQRHGSSGARYPWQSGIDGNEVTVPWVRNPLTGHWQRDHTALQQHVGAALAHSILRYARRTSDLEYLHTKGAAMIFQIAQFYATASTRDPPAGRYHLRTVVGPDEFHDMLPDSAEPGVDDNAYTNIAAASTLELAARLWHDLPDRRREDLQETTGLDQDRAAAWEHISRRMFVPHHDGVISQFAHYEQLRHVSLEDLAERYGSDLGRLDRLMEEDGDHPRNYQIAKQADTLMLATVLGTERTFAVLAHLGYDSTPDTWRRTVEYYLRRTVHGSTLSPVAHAVALRQIDHPQAGHFYAQALRTDLVPGQRTEYGIHLGAMSAILELATDTAESAHRPGR
ncbi:glycoside hydrolase family 65 protein [Streptomyces sp. NPDC050264]|uniref:glycoside hydrolase family 65 protein n=1 Tax=Streptomyces sp. NPDC050264 TaxID=3155038 RepID=UPI003422408E